MDRTFPEGVGIEVEEKVSRLLLWRVRVKECF